MHAVLLLLTALMAQPTKDATARERLIGLWRGTSLCADRVAAPGCNDEQAVYEFTAGTRPGLVHWIADKMVNGKRDRMGESDLEYDNAEACWKVEISSPRVKSGWRLVVTDSHLTGTARLLPCGETIRKLDLHKE